MDGGLTNANLLSSIRPINLIRRLVRQSPSPREAVSAPPSLGHSTLGLVIPQEQQSLIPSAILTQPSGFLSSLPLNTIWRVIAHNYRRTKLTKALDSS